MITMKDLIINLSILTAFLFACSQMFKSDYINDISKTFISKLSIGVKNGILGVILMFFTVQFSNITIIDFRQLAIIYAGYLGGVYASILTSVFIALMRLLAFGPITSASIAASVSSVIIGTGVGLVCTKNLSYWKKWTLCLVVCISVTTAVFIFNLGKDGILPSCIYLIMMVFGGIFTAYLLSFLIRTNTYHFRLKKEATTDFLTGLGNYRTFDVTFNTALKDESDKKEPLSLLIIDIDYFKKINDVYGHLNGDAILTQLGALLKKSARPVDTPARIGGEEFAVLLHKCPHRQALILAEQIRLAIGNHKFILNNGEAIQITISIGVATYPDAALESLKELADQALYQAKNNGRNRVCSILDAQLA